MNKENCHKCPITNIITLSNPDDLSNIIYFNFSKDRNYFITASVRSTLTIYDASTFQILNVYNGGPGLVERAEFSKNGKYLAISYSQLNIPHGMSQRIVILDTSNFQELTVLTGDKFLFSSDGKYLVVSYFDQPVRIYDTLTFQVIFELQRFDDHITNMSFSSNGKYLAIATYAGIVQIWNACTFEPLTPLHLDVPQEFYCYKSSLAFSNDGKYIAVSIFDKNLHIFDVNTFQEVTVFSDASDFVLCAAFSEDSKYLASNDSSQCVRIYDMSTFKEITALRCHSGNAHNVAFSKGDQYLATSGHHNTVRLYDFGRLKSS